MAFAKVPIISKNKINTAGKILMSRQPGTFGFEEAIAIAESWRACHAYPINTFQATLRRKLKKMSDDSLVAQRLKRMPTIIDKLRRYPAMQLSRMQDIGGVRAILNSVDDVYLLAKEYKDKSRFAHELVGERDYIENPRNEDGYRGIHLIYKYKNKQAQEYDGLLLELQIRTKLQHTWATAVETMGTFLGQALKSRLGDREWLDFFSVVSSAFAFIEDKKLLQKHEGMSKKEIFEKIAQMNEELKVLEKIRGYSVAVNEINKQGNSNKAWSYHLIVLNSEQKTVEIKPYRRDSIRQAMHDYSNIEEQASKGGKVEAVLVSAGPLSALRQAYPNFFLDIGDFVENIEFIVSESKK